jgi:hypothetical protein
VSYIKLAILDFDEFCKLSVGGDIILIEIDASFEEESTDDQTAAVRVTGLDFLIHTIVPEKNLIIFHSFPIDLPKEFDLDDEALERFETTERQKLVKQLKEKIGTDKKYATGILLPPLVDVHLDYGALAAIAKVLSQDDFLEPEHDDFLEPEIKICPACNSELHAKVKTCLVCGFQFNEEG